VPFLLLSCLCSPSSLLFPSLFFSSFVFVLPLFPFLLFSFFFLSSFCRPASNLICRLDALFRRFPYRLSPCRLSSLFSLPPSLFSFFPSSSPDNYCMFDSQWSILLLAFSDHLFFAGDCLSLKTLASFLRQITWDPYSGEGCCSLGPPSRPAPSWSQVHNVFCLFPLH
jgi:hypothetical protein